MNLRFDKHQFAGKRAYAVSADTGIDFSDYTRMSTFTHKQAGERRLPTPEWALNDELLRDVLVRYMEARADIKQGTGSLAERLQRARAKLLALIPEASAKLTNLCREYVAIKTAGACAGARLRKLEQEIENVDTVVRMGDCAGIVLRVCLLYYRVRLDSVAVGAEVHLKPPHVRMILWRMNRIAGGRTAKVRKRRCTKQVPAKPVDTIVAAELRMAGYSWYAIAAKLRTTRSALKHALREAQIDFWIGILPGKEKKHAEGRSEKTLPEAPIASQQEWR